MGQAWCRNGAIVKNQGPSPGRLLKCSPAVLPSSQRRNYINRVVEKAIKEELDEESNDSNEKESSNASEDKCKQAFAIISEKEIKTGIKKIRESKIKISKKNFSSNVVSYLSGLICFFQWYFNIPCVNTLTNTYFIYKFYLWNWFKLQIRLK